MEDKIKQFVSEIKKTPNVHVSNKVGFAELKDNFKILVHLRKSAFTFNPIDEKNIKDLYDELKILTLFCLKQNVTIPIKIDGLIQFRTILNHYKSDALSDLDISHSNSKTFFTKYDEQRMRKDETLKMMDNFRYAILRAFNIASANQFPFGIRLDRDFCFLEAYDRSNLTEFSIINLLVHLEQTDTNLDANSFQTAKNKVKKDLLKKRDVEYVIEQIKEAYPLSYPSQLDKFLEDIKDESASTEYSILEIIGSDGATELLDTHENIHILIGLHDVISGELEAINNRNNPWTNINYLFQHIKKLYDISFVAEAKLALKKDEYSDTLNYFKYLIDISPEYCLVPVMAYDVFSTSDFSIKSKEKFDRYQELADLMEGKDVDFLKERYKSIKKIPEFSYNLTNDFYSSEALDVWKRFKKKLSRLKVVLKKLKTQSLGKQTDELKLLAPSKIDGIVSDKFAYNSYVTLMQLFAGNGKTLKNSPDNVVKAVELFMDVYFGDSVFTVSETSFEYTIKDPEFLTLLTDSDSGGNPTSHWGRGVYFLTDKLTSFKLKYEKFEDYKGTNEERRDIHIAELKKITGKISFGWYEDTISGGKAVYCGWDEKGNPINATWEHINNPSQTLGAIRARETNSGDGAKTKVFKTISGYYQYIYEQQTAPKVKKKWSDSDELDEVLINIRKIIKHYKQLGQ